MPGEPDWGASFALASTSAMSFYDEIMVPRLFEPWAKLLLDELKPRSGQALLDVACGPGTVTRHAARRVGPSGRVTGCDLSPAMLELARSKISLDASAPIDYLECPADSLSVPDDAFDLVTCQQGMQFFPNRPAALQDMRRVLRPGGLSTLRSPRKCLGSGAGHSDCRCIQSWSLGVCRFGFAGSTRQGQWIHECERS